MASANILPHEVKTRFDQHGRRGGIFQVFVCFHRFDDTPGCERRQVGRRGDGRQRWQSAIMSMAAADTLY